MGYFSQFYCLLLLCGWYQACRADGIHHPFARPSFLINRTLGNIDKLMNFWQNKNNMSGSVHQLNPNIETWSENENDMLTMLNRNLYNQLSALSGDVDETRVEITDMISDQLKDKVTIVTDEFFNLLADVQSSYETFMELLNNSEQYATITSRQFANVSTSTSNTELQRTLEKLHELFLYHNYKGESLLSIINRNSTTTNLMCIKGESKQQLTIDLFQTLINATIKGVLITLYSYDVRSKYENTPFTFERQQLNKKFDAKIHESYEQFMKTLDKSSREIWACDPPKHRKHITYDKLEEIFQAYIVHDSDVADVSQGSGEGHSDNRTCNSIKDARVRCTTNTCRNQPESKRCIGHLRECKKILNYVHVCYSNDNSERRYDWVNLGVDDSYSELIYGDRNKLCYGTNQTLRIDKAYQNLCACLCENEERERDRYFSLKKVVADETKVVTGVKLTMVHDVFYIQIEQGTLGERAQIIDDPQWKDVKSINPSRVLGPQVSAQQPSRVEYYKNRWIYAVTHKQSYVYLDNLLCGDDTVLTGFKFEQYGDHLTLQIQATPFKYETGVQFRKASYWISPDLNIERSQVNLKKPENPTKFYGTNIVSSDKKYVQFRMSDLENDVGSYTVPFIDIQEVVTNPPMPLTGAGLIHRGKKNSGGFLGLKIIHYNNYNSHKSMYTQSHYKA